MSKTRKAVSRSERQRTGRPPKGDRAAPQLDLVAAVHALVPDVSHDEWKKLRPKLASRVDELLYDRDK